jgi:hypothetical protein
MYVCKYVYFPNEKNCGNVAGTFMELYVRDFYLN